MKVLFTKDIDPLVQNKIYTVKILAFTKNEVTTNQISLVETTTSPALTDETVLVRNGTNNAGKIAIIAKITCFSGIITDIIAIGKTQMILYSEIPQVTLK